MAGVAHRMLLPGLALEAGRTVRIGREEAAHAAHAKRVRPGERVEILDGQGMVAAGVVEAVRGGAGAEVVIRVEAVASVPPIVPRLEVLTSTPKGGRVDELIEGLSQVGAALWQPLATARTIVEPRPAKLERLERLAREASKQCGRAWLLEIGPLVEFQRAVEGGGGEKGDGGMIVADASGEPYEASGLDVVRLLVGPEGGFTPEELATARVAGARIISFGVHTMRIETAAVVAAGIILDQERRAAGGNTSGPARVWKEAGEGG